MKKVSELYRPIDRWLDTHKKLMAVVIVIELVLLAIVCAIQSAMKH